MIHIEVTGPTAGNGWWKELAGLYLGETAGQEFSIHCWKDEEDCIQKALDYGAVQPSNWAYGTQVAGGVTAEFGDFLLSSAQYQKQGPDFGEQMTPFFRRVSGRRLLQLSLRTGAGRGGAGRGARPRVEGALGTAEAGGLAQYLRVPGIETK